MEIDHTKSTLHQTLNISDERSKEISANVAGQLEVNESRSEAIEKSIDQINPRSAGEMFWLGFNYGYLIKEQKQEENHKEILLNKKRDTLYFAAIIIAGELGIFIALGVWYLIK